MTTIKEYAKRNPEMYAMLRWAVETERNIDGLIDKLSEPEIVSYLCNGTTAIKADLKEAKAKMKKAIEHMKIAMQRAEADVIIRETYGGKDGK
jgi:hypothetical protein